MKICHASSLIPDTVIIANIINLLQLLAARHKTNNTTQHDRNEYRSKKEPLCLLNTRSGFSFQLNDFFFSKHDVISTFQFENQLCVHTNVSWFIETHFKNVQECNLFEVQRFNI